MSFQSSPSLMTVGAIRLSCVVEVAVRLLRPQDQVGVRGVGGGKVQLRERRHHLDPARRRAQVVGQAPAGERGAHGLDAERERVAERVGAERHRALGQAGHLGAGERVERVLHLERALGLLGLVEARLLAARKRGHDREGDENASAHERYY